MIARIALYLTIAIIIISPLLYYSSGIGQEAQALSRELVDSAGGSLQSSPKAEALRALTLPIRIEKLLIYPILLLLLQYSGLAARMRDWLERKWLPTIKKIPGYQALDGRLKGLSRNKLSLDNVFVILLYITLFALGIRLLYFPFSIYIFILRHQFALSTQTFSAWLRDFWLAWGVNLLVTLLLYGVFYSLLRLIPRRWPIWVGLGFTIFTFGYTLLEPALVTPLFYEVSPLREADLRERIEVMAGRAGVEIDNIFVIDASSKTNSVNAFFTGFGGASKIFLWDTLLIKHPPDEVDVVVAHEMGHWVYKHVFIGLLGSSALVWLGLFLLRWHLNSVWRGLGWRGPYDVAGYPYLLALIALLALLSLPIVNGLSRYAENQADDFALKISQKPEAAVAMFKGLARENLSPVNAPLWEKLIFYSHPPLSERMDRARLYQIRK